MKPPARTIKKVLQYLTAALCIAFIVYYFFKNADDLKLLSNIKPVLVLTLTASSIFGLFINSYRLQLVLQKSSNKQIPLLQWFRYFILGLFLNQIIPQSGNVYRSMILKKKHGISYTNYITSFLSFTWMQLGLNVLLGIGLIGISQPTLKISEYNAIMILVIIFLIISLLPFLFSVIISKIKISHVFFFWSQKKIAEVLNVSLLNLKDHRYIIKFIMSGLLLFVNSLAIYYFAFLSIGERIHIEHLALFLIMLSLSNRIMITPGNIGLREIAFGVLSEYMNIGMSQGIIISTMMRIVRLTIITVIGLSMGGITVIKEKTYKKANS